MTDHTDAHEDTALLVGRLTAAVDEQQGRVAELRGELGRLGAAIRTLFAQPVMRGGVAWTLEDFERLTEGRD